MKLRGCRVLITGGAGLIGSHIADALVPEGVDEIIVLDNFVRGGRQNLEWASARARVTIVEGDIRDREVVAKALDGIDVLFHQAAIRITQCAEEPRLALEVLVDGTYNVLEAAVAAHVQKVVSASSASVYGMAEEFPTAERHHPYNNRTLYGAAKVFNEGLLRSFYEMNGLDYIALRYFNVYGPRMDAFGAYTEVLIRWIQRISAGEPPLVYGDGQQTMDFVFVKDIAEANVLAAHAGATDQAINVASGTEVSLIQLARTLMTVMGCDLDLEFRAERKVNPVQRRLADTGKAEELLGFRATTTLEGGLRQLVAWWQAAQGAQ
jgi:UDP-glucose 4-epimerase